LGAGHDCPFLLRDDAFMVERGGLIPQNKSGGIVLLLRIFSEIVGSVKPRISFGMKNFVA
jgi:hypothetical protein